MERSGVCLFDETWHQGVVGLVASRIKDQLRRPVIAFARAGQGELRGSGRSVPGIHIRDVLDRIATGNPAMLSRFGGHAMAAGLSLAESLLDDFARAFDQEVRACTDANKPANRIETDGELGPNDIALDTAHALRAGGPWGQAFPEPTFDGVVAIKSTRRIGDRHLKLWVETVQRERSFDAVAFNFFDPTEPQPAPAGEVRLVYRLDVNEYQGERRLQLMVDHILPVDASLAANEV